MTQTLLFAAFSNGSDAQLAMESGPLTMRNKTHSIL